MSHCKVISELLVEPWVQLLLMYIGPKLPVKKADASCVLFVLKGVD